MITYTELQKELNDALDEIQKERAEFGDLKEIVGRFGSKPVGSFPALDKRLIDRLNRILNKMQEVES